MPRQTHLPDGEASVPLQGDICRAALSQDVASRKSTRCLWTGLGWACLMLMGLSARALHPIASHAPAQPSRLLPEHASFSLIPALGPRSMQQARPRESSHASPTASQSAFLPGATSRYTVLRYFLGAASVLLPLPMSASDQPGTPSKSVADFDVAIALAPLLQLRGATAEIDGMLFSDLLQSPSSIQRAGGMAAIQGEEMLRNVRALLKQVPPLEVGREALAAGRRAQILDAVVSDELEMHIREARERFASILEYDNANSFAKRDALNREEVMRPEDLMYYHKADRKSVV